MPSSTSTLSVRGIVYIGRRGATVAVSVITINNTYVIIQNLQNALNAFSCLIIITSLGVTYCYPHFTDKSTDKLGDLSKVTLHKIDPIVLLSWSIAGWGRAGWGCGETSGLVVLENSTWENSVTWVEESGEAFLTLPLIGCHTHKWSASQGPLSIICKMDTRTQAGPLSPLPPPGLDVLCTQHS